MINKFRISSGIVVLVMAGLGGSEVMGGGVK
jgi:hypothetical protein